MIKAKFPSLKQVLYISLVFGLFVFSIALLVLYGGAQSDWHDFDVFYYAAKSALAGKSIYIIVGQYDLPFWYFPWTAWLYIPFALLPHSLGLMIYKLISLLSLIFILIILIQYYRSNFKLLDIALIFSLIMPMSLQLMQVGQMDYILLGVIVLIMFAIKQKREILVGVLLPLIWIKPHIVIVFTLFAYYYTGKRTILISVLLTTLMLAIEFIIDPNWVKEMFNLLQAGSQRIDGLKFTTFPSLLGFQENWVGTGNLPFTIILIVVAIGICWHFRNLQIIPFMSLCLSASLFCAPRAYAYDLPLLIPSLLWLIVKDFPKKLWILFVAASIPFFSAFDSVSYLVTLFVFVLSIWKAYLYKAIKSEDALLSA